MAAAPDRDERGWSSGLALGSTSKPLGRGNGRRLGTSGGHAGRDPHATGYVAARRRATVALKITGELIEVNVEEGMAVRQDRCLPASMTPR
jgi:hypothetical protein